VLVSWRFHSLPELCRPASVSVILDINDDGDPAFSREYPVRDTRGRERMSVPHYIGGIPDVAGISAETAEGVSSDTARVAIK